MSLQKSCLRKNKINSRILALEISCWCSRKNHVNKKFGANNKTRRHADDFKMADKKEENNKQEEENLLNLRWMVRLCDVYEDEYSDCTSIKSRFHQYFVHGQTVDCSAWKRDVENCKRWRDDNNFKAYKDLIASEQKRRHDRLKPHFENDTWKKRAQPPVDWDKPLPAWLEEENKGTLLGLKAEEIRNHGKPVEGERSLCVIS